VSEVKLLGFSGRSVSLSLACACVCSSRSFGDDITRGGQRHAPARQQQNTQTFSEKFQVCAGIQVAATLRLRSLPRSQRAPKAAVNNWALPLAFVVHNGMMIDSVFEE
jgi:hypothetical protein